MRILLEQRAAVWPNFTIAGPKRSNFSLLRGGISTTVVSSPVVMFRKARTPTITRQRSSPRKRRAKRDKNLCSLSPSTLHFFSRRPRTISSILRLLTCRITQHKLVTLPLAKLRFGPTPIPESLQTMGSPDDSRVLLPIACEPNRKIYAGQIKFGTELQNKIVCAAIPLH